MKWKRLLRAPFFSPHGYLMFAGTFAAVLLVLHLLGFRESLSVLAFTVPEGLTAQRASVYAGLYLIFHLLVVLVCPVLVLAAVIHTLLARAMTGLGAHDR